MILILPPKAPNAEIVIANSGVVVDTGVGVSAGR